MSVVQGQWGLETTAEGMFQFSRGLVMAATSDNVQPLAILACQQFGNTLAMSQETCRKVERLVLPSPELATIRFIKATVGFYKNDCATQLGGNSAGIRFLGLASALLNSVSFVEATKAIHTMLQESASDLTLAPTFFQVDALLQSIEARCLRCGFANMTVGYQLLLSRLVMDHIPQNDIGGLDDVFASQPSPQMITRLIEAFRQLARIGKSTVIGVEIEVTCAVAWTVSFTKWCIGIPPIVYWGDRDESPIISQPGSTVTIRIMKRAETTKNCIIRINHDIIAPTHLIAPLSDPHLRVFGMVNMESYGQLLLDRLLRGCSAPPATVLKGVFPILSLIYETIPVSSVLRGSFSHAKRDGEGSETHRLSPFPDAQGLGVICAQLFDLAKPPDFSKPLDRLVAPLQDVMEQLRESCTCKECNLDDEDKKNGNGYKYRGDIDDWWSAKGRSVAATCKKFRFVDTLALILMDILSLSLFHCSRELLLSTSPSRPNLDTPDTIRFVLMFAFGLVKGEINPQLTTYTVHRLFSSRVKGERCAQDVYGWAQTLLGHSAPPNDGSKGLSVMCSSRGQVFYPLLFDTNQIPTNGYLSIVVCPGILKFENETISKIQSNRNTRILEDELELITIVNSPPEPVIAPINRFPDIKVTWKINYLHPGTLSATVSVKAKDGRIFGLEVNPFDGIGALPHAITLEACGDHSQSNLQAADEMAVYKGVYFKRFDNGLPASPDTIHVIAIDGAEDLRLVFLAQWAAQLKSYIDYPDYDGRRPDDVVVLRGSACLACCLKLCREVNAKTLIL
ncbi:Fc.00g009230.m01.CDS01 [Cosmosporella sp. VM-42]